MAEAVSPELLPQITTKLNLFFIHMKHQQNIANVMNDFFNHLPDPLLSSSPAIFADFSIEGEPLKLVAQKIKGQSGLTWKVSPIIPSGLR